MKSLDKLVDTMNDDDFKLTRQLYNDEEQFYLMRKKGVFPYDFFDSLDKLEYSSFPSREKFYNMMNDEECSIKVRFSIFLSSLSFSSFIIYCYFYLNNQLNHLHSSNDALYFINRIIFTENKFGTPLIAIRSKIIMTCI